MRTSVEEELPGRIAALMEERKEARARSVGCAQKLAMGGGAANGAVAAKRRARVGNVQSCLRARWKASRPRTSRVSSMTARKQIGSGVVAIVGVTEDGKAGVVVGVTADLTSRFSAVDLVKIASANARRQGRGGRPDMAQAGGPDGAKADAALDAIETSDGRRVVSGNQRWQRSR